MLKKNKETKINIYKIKYYCLNVNILCKRAALTEGCTLEVLPFN